MDRREWLQFIGASAVVTGMQKYFPQAAHGQQNFAQMTQNGRFGWTPRPEETEKFIKSTERPFLHQQNHLIRDSGEGKKALWWRVWEKVTGMEFQPHNQGIGDCVSHSFGLGVDFLTAVQIEFLKRREKWIAKCATEVLYGGGRCEIGDQFGRWSDGSTGVWQAEWLTTYGVLLRQAYPGGHDFTTYDPDKAKTFGSKGVPDDLEDDAAEHPVKTTALVSSWEECRDALYNGHLVAVCSNAGFNSTRDSEGFLRRRGRWYHCMLLAGMDDEYRRPGALCINSWGPDWVNGPTRHNQPAGSFWIDADDVDYMMRQQDSFALSNYVGYPSVVIPPYVIW